MLGRRESAARAHASQQPSPQIRTSVWPCRKTSLAGIVPRIRRLDVPSAASIQRMSGRGGSGRAPEGEPAQPGLRDTENGENACCVGMSSIAFTFTCAGSDTAQRIASATSSADSGVMPS